VISTLIDEAQPLEPAIREFSRELRESLAHASIPFQTVAEEVAPTRRSGRHPIFQSMFVYQETPPAPKLGNARLEPLVLDLGASKFDLSLFVTEAARSASPELAVEYRADRFDEAWMEKLLGHYETLLESLPEDLARNTADAPMLGEPELLELRRFAKGAELDTELSLGLLPNQILDQARRSPDSPAVISGGVSQSYAELVSSAGSIARKLSARGVKPGDRVGLFLNRSALMIAGILGSHWAGAAYVPLDPEYPRARNRDVLQDADVAAVLTTSSLKRRMPERSWATIDVGELDGSGDEPLDFDAAPVDLSPESPAYILYTSGSTGRPKGVVVTHHNLRASTAARLQYYGVAPQRFLLVPSISFDSSVAGLFWTLAVGGALVIPTEQEARDPERLAELIAEQRVMSLLCVPSLYAQLLGAGSAGTDMLAGLETAIVAGESCPPQLVEEHFRALPNARLLNEYGPTEATVWATVHEISREDLGRQVPIGRPIPGVRVDVLDALGRPVPAGIPGEAFIAGPTVTPGYWRRPELGDESFVTHTHRAGTSSTERRYRTGDRMAWTRDGRLLFMGRVDEQIKLRGFRIEPGEIEAVLTESREIERAAVVARPSGASPGTMQLIAFVETSTDGDDALDVDEWRPDLKQRLPDHMIPSRLVVVSELPRLPNGKVDREQLRDSVLEPDARTETCADVPSTLEQALISLWEGLLGHAGIGATDNFFELGGNSLLVVEMTRAIERDFSVKLSAADVFEVPTVRELASRIEQRGGPETPSYQHLYPIQPTGSGTTFIVAVPHFFTQTFAERFRGERPVYGLRGVGLRAEGNRGRWPTMSDLGEELVDEIRRRFPGDDGFLMAGYSFGASMAVEAVRLMEERGIPVRCLYLIAPMPVDFYRIGPFRVQLDGLRKPVEDLSITEALRHFARGNNPLTRRPYRRAWRWLAIQPWRRLMASVGKLRRRAGRQLTPRILHADVRVERFRLHARYRPGIIHTPTVIFNAKETETDAAATWRPYFRGPFTVHETPDPHLGEASADAASRVILRHLRDLDW
jgi:amino acid adenylation domain-containing protein